MKRTLKVKDFIVKGNELLAMEGHSPEFREGIICMMEYVFHQSNSYGGYSNLYWLKQGYEEWRKAGEPNFPEKIKFFGDDTRRVYFIGGE